MKRRCTSLFVLAALLAGAALPVRAAKIPSGPPIVIGAVLSITGPFAPLGEPEANALRLSERTINERGGIAGRPLRIEIVDDEGKADTAAQLATKMIAAGAIAIIGGTTSNTTASIARVTIEAKKLQIYPTPVAAFWDTKNGVAKTVFETTPRNEIEAAALVDFAAQRFRARKFAILHDENTVGTVGASIAVAELTKRGFEIVSNDSYPTAATDVTAQLQKVKNSGADTLILWGASPALGIIARQIRQYDIKANVLSSTGTLSQNFLRVAGSAADGQYSDTALNFTHPTRTTFEFLDRYRKAYKQSAVQFASFAWDAAHLVAFAVENAHGKTDGETLAAVLETMKPYEGTTGVYRFTERDHNGLAVSAIHIVTVRNGVFETLAR